MIYCLRASGQLVVMGMNMILGAVGTLEGAKLAGQRGNNYSDWDKAQKKCEPFHLDIVVGGMVQLQTPRGKPFMGHQYTPFGLFMVVV